MEEEFYNENGFDEEGNTFTVTVKVTNTGKCTGSEVMQLYVAYEQEIKKLCDFSKVHLKAGESKFVTLACKKSEMQVFDEESRVFKVRQGRYSMYLGNSSKTSQVFPYFYTVLHEV